MAVCQMHADAGPYLHLLGEGSLRTLSQASRLITTELAFSDLMPRSMIFSTMCVLPCSPATHTHSQQQL